MIRLIQQNVFLGIIIVALIIAIATYVVNKNKKESEETIVREFYGLGTIIRLRVDGKNGEKAIQEAVDRLNIIENKMSVFKEFSEVSMINKNAGVSGQEVSSDTFFLIKRAVEYSELSEGTFDPTIMPIVSLWRIGSDNPRMPSKREIERTLKLVNYEDIIINEKSHSIGLKHRNQAIDVGGIAKGYAADEVKNVFENHKINSALIDLGGNIYALGTKPDKNLWNVGIQNPFDTRGEHIGVISVENKSIVTSGNYERYFTKGGKIYHHIIDPKTGYPSESEVISSTIISDHSIDGDGLSTGVYIMGLEKSIKLIESLKGIDAIFITKNKEVYATSGIKNSFNITNTEFIYKDNL
ncbi:FAD:protein FMN transferase [Clostridium saccharoperbutylacetonicum]|uniref:FAD:protein FMN transferase n=1 Tax=Clostridium saccharoperbutylacetonicum TaxID=36745 RepID=UPI000984039A|nr:FAD:protein FMN transferase [Clostridium saccharoperbutylacetonicum]AQR96214.1 thiamine biosynthesis lipoprotein ApbE precursor [Clostridium saccharoperbutylacetonicum]NSB32087.1 thiamine biosynthesis lipoprotein [Clostridium saccharoperbutylacetonicum]